MTDIACTFPNDPYDVGDGQVGPPGLIAAASAEVMALPVPAVAQAEGAMAVTWPSGFELRPSGLWFVGDKNPEHLTGPIEPIGLARDRYNNGWGLVVRWADPDDCGHQTLIARADLISQGADVLRPLLSAGLWLNPNTRALSLLKRALLGTAGGTLIRLTDRTGWHESTFVLPGETIGTLTDERILFNGHAESARYAASGKLDDWIEAIARPAAGNTRLVMAICAAFEGPLGELLGDESGGYHFVGPSSIGKTTLLNVAGSVWGGGRRGFLHTWRATDNAIEGIARAHSGTLLALDEIGELDPRKAGEVAYMLINGQGKGRMRSDEAMRPRGEWRVTVLSTGEMTLADRIAEGGRVAKAGQLLRVIDIPADAGRRHGLFDDPKGHTSSAFANMLKEASARFYGTAGPTFIRYLVDNLVDVRRAARVLAIGIKERLLRLAPEGGGQIERVAARLSLVAAAGQIAQNALDLPWADDETEGAAQACFTAWLQLRGGTGAGDMIAAYDAIREAIERLGDGRFKHLDDDGKPDNFPTQIPIRDLLGYRKIVDGRTVWCFTSTGLNEILKGLARRQDVVDCLRRDNLLTSSPSDTSYRYTLRDDGRVVHTFAIRHEIVSHPGERS